MYFDEFRDFDADWLRKINLQVARDKGDEEGNPHKLMVPSKFIWLPKQCMLICNVIKIKGWASLK